GQDRQAAAGRPSRRAGGLEPAGGPQAKRGPGQPGGGGGADLGGAPISQIPCPGKDRMNSLLPLLATPAAPFASQAYLWEVKWDGMRALAASEGGPWRQWAKGHRLYRALPGAGRAGRLPAGTVLDGGLVVLQNGQADFPALPRRHQRQHPNPLG